jgi:hypothetical protein
MVSIVIVVITCQDKMHQPMQGQCDHPAGVVKQASRLVLHKTWVSLPFSSSRFCVPLLKFLHHDVRSRREVPSSGLKGAGWGSGLARCEVPPWLGMLPQAQLGAAVAMLERRCDACGSWSESVEQRASKQECPDS